MKDQLEQFTKQFFEGLKLKAVDTSYCGIEWRGSVRGEPQTVITWQYAQQIALEVMIREKKLAVKALAALSAALSPPPSRPNYLAEYINKNINGLKQEIIEIEKLREELG